jgi:hypothetical protein
LIVKNGELIKNSTNASLLFVIRIAELAKLFLMTTTAVNLFAIKAAHQRTNVLDPDVNMMLLSVALHALIIDATVMMEMIAPLILAMSTLDVLIPLIPPSLNVLPLLLAKFNQTAMLGLKSLNSSLIAKKLFATAPPRDAKKSTSTLHNVTLNMTSAKRIAHLLTNVKLQTASLMLIPTNTLASEKQSSAMTKTNVPRMFAIK